MAETMCRLINHFEVKARWARSQICVVDYKREKVLLFIGSKNWIAAPPLLSLLTLLLRTIAEDFVHGNFRKNISIKKFISTAVDELDEDMVEMYSLLSGGDTSFVTILMSKKREIFGLGTKKKGPYSFIPKKPGNVHGQGGIKFLYKAVCELKNDTQDIFFRGDPYFTRYNAYWALRFVEAEENVKKSSKARKTKR